MFIGNCLMAPDRLKRRRCKVYPMLRLTFRSRMLLGARQVECGRDVTWKNRQRFGAGGLRVFVLSDLQVHHTQIAERQPDGWS